MHLKLPETWHEVLKPHTEQTYFAKLLADVANEYDNNVCFPSYELVFKAFEECAFDDIKVVIIGQDPYHGPGQAHGLAFSVLQGCPPPPSLLNIFRELHSDIGEKADAGADLTRWAKQGVLLLNATLTVREASPGSHQKIGWEQFTDAVISAISERKDHIVFMLWGNFAKTKGRKIDRSRHLVLESGHPSPLSANRKLWFGNRHFSRANQYLITHGKKAVQW